MGGRLHFSICKVSPAGIRSSLAPDGTNSAAMLYRADISASANTASHPTITIALIAPAVILSFSFVV